MIFTLQILQKIEIIILTISDKSLIWYELGKKLKNARENGFIFDEINKSTLGSYINLSHINICFCLKLKKPMFHRHFFRIVFQNPETFCKDRINHVSIYLFY